MALIMSGPISDQAALYRAVRLTARTSGLLFAASQAAPALGPRTIRAAQPLYLGFLAAHATHFAVVARYARVTGGRALFPGGRNLGDVGGWPTVLGIYTFFAALALTGRAAAAPDPTGRPTAGVAARVATGIIGTMYVGTYLGQLSRSRWYAAPAGVIATAVAANALTARNRRHERGAHVGVRAPARLAGQWPE
ncbi:MAG: hypothetical protein ACLGIF_02670 [Actinomycetes bacterium]